MFSLRLRSLLSCGKCLQMTYSRLRLHALQSKSVHLMVDESFPAACQNQMQGSLITETDTIVRPFSCSAHQAHRTVHADCPNLASVDSRNISKNLKPLHVPVMAGNVVDIVNPKSGQVILDMTFGAGGHTKALLDRTPGIQMFCLDRDPVAHELAQKLADDFPQVTPLLGKFSEAHTLLSEYGIGAGCVDAVLFDLGASSMQFDTPHRGFSISSDAPLDMRMDSNRLSSADQPTATDVVNWMDEPSLYRVIKRYGEERHARLIARAIVDSRYAFGVITTTRQLADVVASAMPGTERQDKLERRAHPATKTFQALRIFVNNELNELHNGLEVALHLLRAGSGVCAAISFHSLEDRIVKHHFHASSAATTGDVSDSQRSRTRTYPEPMLRRLLEKCWRPLVSGVIEASEEETCSNPRARSAKLRAAVKL